MRVELPPEPAPTIVGGGEVMIEFIVDERGTVTRPVIVRGTPPYTEMILKAIAQWQFEPARAVDERGTERPVQAPITVSALYRPPTLLNGPTLGEAPKEFSRVSGDVAYPLLLQAPAFPPQALFGSVLLYEVVLNDAGILVEARSVASTSGFETAARDSLAKTRFRGATYRARPVPVGYLRVVWVQAADDIRGGSTAINISSNIVPSLSSTFHSSPGQLRRAYWAWIAVCVSWGTTYLATRVAIDSIPPFAMAGPRHFIAGIIMALVLRLSGIKLPPKESWGGHALLGLLMIGIGNGCLVWAQQFVPTGVAAVMVSVIPFWMIGVEAFMPHGESIQKRQVVGLLLGFGGIVLLTSSSLNGGAPTPQVVLGVIMTQLSCLGWAIGSAYAKRHKREDNLFAATSVQIICGGAILMVVATITGEWSQVAPTPRSLLAVLYLVVVGTFVGYVCYVYALKHLPVAIVSLYAYFNPVIAVILGSLILKERFTPRMAVAIAIIFLAMLIVRTADTSRSSSEPA